MSKRLTVFSFLVVCLLSTIGCVSQSATHVKNFSDASSSLTAHTQTVLDAVDSSTIERKLHELATLPPDRVKALSLEDLAYVKGVYANKNKLPVFRAISTLKKYTNALGNLSTADFRKDIDSAAEDLYGAMTSMQKEYKEITTKDLGLKDETFAIIATAVDAIGTVIVEKKRADAIKKIVTENNEHIAVFCDVIHDNVAANVDLVKINTNRIVREKIEAYKKQADKMVLESKLVELRKIHTAVNNYNNIDLLYKDAQKSPMLVKKAHQALYDAVQKDKFTTENIVKTIGEMNEFKSHLESFYKELLTEKDK